MYQKMELTAYYISKLISGLSVLLHFGGIDLLACGGTIIPQKLTPWHGVPNMDGTGGIGAFPFNIPSDSVIVFNKPIINLSNTPEVNRSMEKDTDQAISKRHKYVQTMCKMFPVRFQSKFRKVLVSVLQEC